MPKVTVLMAVHNGERYVREAVDSVVHQTFTDFEFLIVNDGSTDKTRELILSCDDPRIRLIENDQNIGQTKSLNRGLQMATGQLIARQDADDNSEPERLSRQVMFMDTHTDVALLGTWYKKIDADGNDIGLRTLPCSSTDIRWSLLFFCPFVHSSVMLRKSLVLERVGLYNETLSYSQDFELWHRIARRLPVANLPEYLLKYRISPSSMTSTYGDQVQEGHRIRITNIKHLLGRNDTTDTVGVESQFHFMFRLLFGSETAVKCDDIPGAVREIFRLQSAFCAYFKVDEKDCKSHRVRLRGSLSRRLHRIAYDRYHQGDYAAAAQLLLKAFLLGPVHITQAMLPVPLNLISRRCFRNLSNHCKAPN